MSGDKCVCKVLDVWGQMSKWQRRQLQVRVRLICFTLTKDKQVFERFSETDELFFIVLFYMFIGQIDNKVQALQMGNWKFWHYHVSREEIYHYSCATV